MTLMQACLDQAMTLLLFAAALVIDVVPRRQLPTSFVCWYNARLKAWRWPFGEVEQR